MKAKVYRLMSLLPIAVAVGFMTFITAWICLFMDWTIWLAFLSWALYFMHGANLKGGIFALGAFILGIILAQLAIYYIGALFDVIPEESLWRQFVIPSSVFLVASVITFVMRFNRAGSAYIPAVYIGTVFRFAYNDLHAAHPEQVNQLISHLVFPIIFGLFIGWCTVSLLELLDKLGVAEWRKRWILE